jgi:CheY-like chemotaxis protein
MKKILVIEDNDMNRDLLVQILEEDYAILEAEDAQQGLDMSRDERPDLILTDISLPGMDGLELVSHIRQTDLLRDIPVIAVTAHAMTGDRERTLDAGCDAYISKPIDEELLLDKIDELIGA